MTWYLVISAIAACLAALRLLQVVGERRDARRFPPPGRMVGPAGRRLHVLIKGSGPGPAIVIEQGAGGFGVLWWAVQDALAEFATVVTYDRLGLGWSDPAPARRGIDERVEDLRALLDAAEVAGPYLFVAHSYGGLLVRKFARRHPERTAGLVLVDTVEEGIHFQPEVLQLYGRFNVLLAVLAAAQFLGVLRLWQTLFPDKKTRSDRRLAALAALSLRPGMFLGMRNDMSSLAQLPAAERQPWPARSFGSLPLTVITHGQPFPGPLAVVERHWAAGQERLARLSSAGLLVVARHSNHMIQDDEPELVIDAIRQTHVAAMDETLRQSR